jgi:leucyl/phenylalanyl-tRNA---protein transferase
MLTEPYERLATVIDGSVPTEPPTSSWVFPDPTNVDDDLVGIGADLEPGTLLSAYRHGMFPMPSGEPGMPMLWWSPLQRGILPLDRLRVSRSLRQSAKQMEIRVDTAFEEVIAACADPRRDSGWIDKDIIEAYTRLHELGWVHSVETWQEGRLVGGLYGVATGGLFAGESMFHRVRDASKVALLGLVGIRATYLERLRHAVEVPLPTAFFSSSAGGPAR